MQVSHEQYTVVGRVVFTSEEMVNFIKEAVRANPEFAGAELVIEPALIPAIAVEVRKSKSD